MGYLNLKKIIEKREPNIEQKCFGRFSCYAHAKGNVFDEKRPNKGQIMETGHKSQVINQSLH